MPTAAGNRLTRAAAALLAGGPLGQLGQPGQLWGGRVGPAACWHTLQLQQQSALSSSSSGTRRLPLLLQQQPQQRSSLPGRTLSGLWRQQRGAQPWPGAGGWQLQQAAGVKQLLPEALAPRPLPRFHKPSRDGRMNRAVLRIPPQVGVEVADGQLRLTGKAGSTALSLSFLDPTGLVAWQCHTQSAAGAAAGPGTGSLLLLASPSKRCWRGIQTHINNAVHGVMQGYLVGLTVQGVGYRMEPVSDPVIQAALEARRGDSTSSSSGGAPPRRQLLWESEAEKTNIAYPHKQPAKAVRLKVGFTRACIYQLPQGVLAFFVKPTLLYLYGLDKALVNNTAAAIRAIRKPNAYTGNGIQLVGETIKLKQRAGSK